MYTYSPVFHFSCRIGYAEDNDNKWWYVGKSTSLPLCMLILLLSPQNFVLYYLQRYVDIFNHFLCWLAGRDYFTLCLLHGGECAQQVQSNYMYCFSMLYILLVCPARQLHTEQSVHKLHAHSECGGFYCGHLALGTERYNHPPNFHSLISRLLPTCSRASNDNCSGRLGTRLNTPHCIERRCILR